MRFLVMTFVLLFVSSGLLAESCGLPVLVGSWNTKHLGRKSFDYKSAVKLLKDFDVVALQEVNKSRSGAKALAQLKMALSGATKEKWCSALSLVPTGSRERYGYLWKNGRLSWVKSKSGKVLLDCSDNHLTAQLVPFHQSKIVREPSLAIFKSKLSNYKFKLASVHLVPTKKTPEREVPFLFDALKPAGVPVIVAGDFNLSADSVAFHGVRKKGWINVFAGGVKTSLKMKKKMLNKAYDNFWVFDRGYGSAGCKRSIGVKNTYRIFSHLPIKHVYNKISDHAPIYMQLFDSINGKGILKPVAPTLKSKPNPPVEIKKKPVTGMNCGSRVCMKRTDKRGRNYCMCKGKRGRAKMGCCK